MQDASVWPDSTLTLTDLFFKLYSNLVGKFVRELQAVEIIFGDHGVPKARFVRHGGDSLPSLIKTDYSHCHAFSAGETLFVLDTKYKTPESPSNPDINQIVTYSVAKRCKRAILIYPAEIPNSFVGTLHDINVRTMTFSLADDLEKAGQLFLNEMLSTLSNHLQK
jgi:hypothetical protein